MNRNRYITNVPYHPNKIIDSDNDSKEVDSSNTEYDNNGLSTQSEPYAKKHPIENTTINTRKEEETDYKDGEIAVEIKDTISKIL